MADSMVKLCCYSSSQEELLHRVTFTEGPDLQVADDSPDCDGFPVASVGIEMVSRQDSWIGAGTPRERFQIRPKKRVGDDRTHRNKTVGVRDGHGNVAVDAAVGGVDSQGAVDLAKDFELGFPGEALAAGSRAVHLRRVSPRLVEKKKHFVSKDEGSGHAALNKLKPTKPNPSSQNPNSCATRTAQNSKSELSKTGTGAFEFHDADDREEVDPLAFKVPEKTGKRVEIGREEGDDETQRRGKRLLGAMIPDAIEICSRARFNGDGPSSSTDCLKSRHLLPLSVGRQAAVGDSDSATSAELWSKTVPMLLERFSRKGDGDSLAKESIFDIAKRRGMVFPQPGWWRFPEGYGPRRS